MASKTHKRGFTIVEVMVSSTIVLVCMGLIWWVMRTAATANRVETAAGQAYRDCLISIRRLKQELRGARVQLPEAGDPAESSLTYLKPRLDSQGLLTTDEGRPEWDGPVICSLNSGRIVTDQSDPPFLGKLRDGELSFRRPSFDLLEIVVTSRHPREDGLGVAEHSMAVVLPLENQPGI